MSEQLSEVVETISSVEVTEANERLEVLPRLFANKFMVGEVLTYSFLSKLCDTYQGAYWKYYSLSNGGFYMAPDVEGPLRIEWPLNYFSGEMSPDAAGITATLFALSHLACSTGCERLTENFHLLRDYLDFHAEAGSILAAID